MLKNNDIDFGYLVDKQLLDTDWLKIYQSKEDVTFVASCVTQSVKSTANNSR